MNIHIQKGHDLKLVGVPAKSVQDINDSTFIKLHPSDFPGVKPKLLVKVGETLKKGQAVYNDKNNSVPNFKGKTFKEALRIANIKGLTLSPDAISGKIIWQSIQPGKTFENNEICELKLKL